MQLINRFRLTVVIPLACLLLLALWGAPATTTYAESSAASSAFDSSTTYVVQRGDTLYSIAERFNVTAREIADANNITNVNLVRVGQVLTIPGQVNGTIPYPTATSGNGTIPYPTATPYYRPTRVKYPTRVPAATAVPTNTPTPYVPPVIESPWTAPSQLVEVFSPVARTAYRSPMEVVGFSRTFESTVAMRLVDENGYVLAERSAMGGGVDGYDFFQTYLRFIVTEPVEATLEFYQTAGEGDDLPVQASIPVTLLPGQRSVDLLEPSVNDIVCGAFTASGYSWTFEGNVPVTLYWRNGAEVAVKPAIGGGVEYRDWNITLNEFSVSEPQPILLSVHDESAEDGSQIDTTRIPLSMYPIGHPACSQ